MRCPSGVQFCVACLLMATLIGITGFVIVYHYVKLERPLQLFAIVIDAGSTQTRSGLFSVSVDLPKLANLADEVIEGGAYELDIVGKTTGDTRITAKRAREPLSKLMTVTQVSNCVNGGPLASVKSESSARELVNKCLVEFSEQIRLLEAPNLPDSDESDSDREGDEGSLDPSSRWPARGDGRTNSVTYLFMGATAGMRALKELDGPAANQIVRWVDSAAAESNQRKRGPFINKGAIGIIEGGDEAKFTWLSVNFVCDRLSLQLVPESAADLVPGLGPANYQYTASDIQDKLIYEQDWSSAGMRRKEELERYARKLRQANELNDVLASVGTVELGGASVQIAYRVPSWTSSEQVANNSLLGQSFQLFNERFALATRSDLCLGASQTVLRVEYLLLMSEAAQLSTRLAQIRSSSGSLDALEEIENPCLHNGARKSFDAKQLLATLNEPCLAPSKLSESQIQELKILLTSTRGNNNNSSASNGQQQQQRTNYSAGSIRFFGTGDTKKCGLILTKLLDLNECRQTFSICPTGSGLRGTGPQKLIEPPSSMPFVTIAGYNKALKVLNLSRSDSEYVESEPENVIELELLIAERLGGHSIDYLELVTKTEEFCKTKITELPSKYPLVNNRLMATTCLSLLYIDKILTSYYNFEPNSSWKQLKFLLFEPSGSLTSSSDNRDMRLHQTSVSANDIGWTLGLLLNATVQHQFQPMIQTMGTQNGGGGGVVSPSSQTVYYHHKAPALFVLRTTLFLMIASALLALSIILIAVIAIKRRSEDQEESSFNVAQQQRGVYQTHSYGGISVLSSDQLGISSS